MIGGWSISELTILAVVGLAGLVLAIDDWRGMLLAWALMGAAGGFLLRQTAEVPGELAGIQILNSALLALLFYLAGRRAQATAPKTLTARPAVHWRFRILAALFLYVLARMIVIRFPLPIASPSLLIVTYTLIGIGLLIATLSRSPLKAGLGVLTMLNGYQVFYLSVQDSLLAIGLMAGMSLFVAFVTAALTLVRQEVSA
ncbi:hypothetical protein [Thermoflexus sp.]|uniref:hypothetical protein n=1 Tax=Thermoflexus sp. TaxID=1969742 RepID=UPI0025CDE8ED|nr:hypothetical protein [Thermoflexus sp.]MDW8181564.1 hypothetical protein [Anaerolineae bacterium]MCS6962623.1 hypothetical protein [Thermoflexus sp.]MCS7352105.1 hypothetical protein [Thermoflexus sp.]MCX7690593.1 hypothetical protein [Thermoflexus sp.]MDW8185049.1 hypothetical protein [Anaerolineae bacterium]